MLIFRITVERLFRGDDSGRCAEFIVVDITFQSWLSSPSLMMRIDYGDDDSALDEISKKGCYTCLYVLILFMNKNVLGKI